MAETTYSIEHAKTSRSKCKRCKEPIIKDDFRLGVTVPADPERQGSFGMTAYYHVGCFILPKRLKHMGADEFVREMVEDITEDGSILPDQFDKIVTEIEKAGGATKKKATAEQEETFMTRVVAAAKEDLGLEAGKQPPKKKPKKEEKKLGEDEEEFCQMVELYKQHYKTKTDDLKDFLRWNRQVLTGKKDFVLFKVLDGHLHGRLGWCPLDGGRLKFLEGDYDTVHCSGNFDESSQVRIPCSYTGKRRDPNLREKPFFTQEPTQAEQDEMDKLKDAASGSGSAALGSEAGKALLAATDEYEWDLKTDTGIKKAAAQLVDLVQDKVDLPEGRDPKRLLGQILVANKEKGIQGVVEEIINQHGFKEAKEAKKAAKEEATKKVCANPKNAPLLLAFQELSELYFKQGNANAGSSSKKVVNALKDLEVEVTAENAMSFTKGKTKVPNIGKSSGEKMKEFMQTGTMAKLEEKRALQA